MTTHLRARALQAGALLALVGGFLLVAPSPAQAIDLVVRITSVSARTVNSGQQTTIEYTVLNPNPGEGNVQIEVSGMDCSGNGCSPETQIGPQGRSFSATLTAPNVPAGSSRDIAVRVNATFGNDRGAADTNIKVNGPAKAQTVRQISGKVRDGDGESIDGAQVIMQDSAGNRYETRSNGSGNYSFNSSDSKPIAPGSVSVGAGKDGYTPAAVNVNAEAGKSVNVPLTLESTAAPTPSATPTPTEEASEAPTDEETAATEESAAPADNASNESDDEGSGSLLFIILGGLFMAAGVGAIVLIVMRRKNNGGDDAADDPIGTPPGGPAGGGRFGDATRVAAPVGGRANDATMIAPMGAAGAMGAGGMGAGAMADAPTVLQRPVPAEDEFPDPYGAPARPQQNVYGGGGGGGTYGGNTQVPPQQSGGYDDYDAGPPTQYGEPVRDDEYSGYGAQQQNAYGAPQYGGAPQQRYDEPTGMYRPEPAYNQGGDDGGYGQQDQRGGGQYGGGGYDQGGYDDQGGGGYGSYGGGQQDQRGGGTYGGGQQGGGNYGGGQYGGGGGYDQGPQQGGYDQGGYDDRGGYPQQGGYDQGGYDDRGGYPQQQGGYGQQDQRGGGTYGGGQQGGGQQGGGYDQGGYDDRQQHDPRQQGGGRPGQRRPVNWMDD